jgi:hydrogenase maturation factor
LSDVGGLVTRFEELRVQGQGYIEIRAEAEFPVVTLGFKDSVAVVQLMGADDGMSLLVADPLGNGDAEVLVMDELVEFTADFVLDVDRAWQAVEEIVHTGDPARAGEWYEL